MDRMFADLKKQREWDEQNKVSHQSDGLGIWLLIISIIAMGIWNWYLALSLI
jgi:uncharacterized membrane protein YkgB